jgi:shikimate dehydrogenase
MKRAFVAGWPISHSLSPLLHAYWLEKHGVDGIYEPVAIPPDRFASFLRNLAESGYTGGNITIPHKEAAFRICQNIDENALSVGAVNTVWLENGTIQGSNTDVYGFLANLDENAPGWDRTERALVLGAGGAARAVLHALMSRNIETIVLANRTRGRAEALAAIAPAIITASDWDRAEAEAAACRLIVNTTSLGMKGQPPLDFDPRTAPTGAVVNDLVYNPLQTGILAAAARAGLVAVDGLGMLLHQAVPGFEKWFGLRPKVDAELRARLIEKLGVAMQ